MTRVLAAAALLLFGARLAHADANVTLCASDDQGGAGVNLTSALAIGGHITFSCGGAATIMVNCTHSLSADTDIDGGGSVTLQGNAGVPGCGGLAAAYSMFANASPIRRSLRLSKLHIAGAKPKPDGGVTTLTAGNVARGNLDLTLSDVTITNSYAPIVIDQGSVTVARSEISNSVLQAIVAPAITITDHSHLTGNGGSPLVSTGGKVAIADSDFTGNHWVSDLTRCTGIDIRNAQFTNNVTGFSAFGGALQTNCSARIASSTFTGNQAIAGGGIFIGDQSGHTTLIDVEFNGNIADDNGGGIGLTYDVDPGVPPIALELHHVTFRANRARVGGGLWFGRAEVRGAVLNPRTLTGAAVQFLDNQATAFAGGLFTSRADVRLSKSLFMGNRAATTGGAVVGIGSDDGSLELSNSILVKNGAASGAAFAGNGATFINSTLADNTGPAVSAMATVEELQIAAGTIGPQPIRLQNTIVSGGSGSPCGPADPAGPYQDLGNNLQYPVNSCASSIVVRAPQFGPSYIPLPTSPAANAGNDAVCAAVPVAGRDIWDKTRPKGTHCTIGAAEADIQNIIQQSLTPLVRGISAILGCSCGWR